MVMKKKIFLLFGFATFLLSPIIVRAAGGSSSPAIKVGDPAGGDLTGTYPNPTISPDASLSVSYLETSGHLNGIGAEPTVVDNPSFCGSGIVSVEAGSNQVRGRVVMGPTDTSCVFKFADGTGYQDAYCTANISGGVPPAPISISTSNGIGFIIQKPETIGRAGITYICLGN